MINEAYEQGRVVALQEIEKLAGVEFAEKVAGAKWDSVKNFGGKAAEKVKGFYAGAKKDMSDAGRSTGEGSMFKGKKVDPVGNKMNRLKSGAKGVAKYLAAPAAVGAAGYGGYKAAE